MCAEEERCGWWAFIHCSLLCCVVLMVYSVIDFPAFSSMFVVELDAGILFDYTTRYKSVIDNMSCHSYKQLSDETQIHRQCWIRP